jgi:hypothetical protein
MLWLIDRVTSVRVGDTMEDLGLDAGLFHEQAYGID